MKNKLKDRNRLYIFFEAIYVIVIIYITCLSRTSAFLNQIAPYPFWSYVKLLQGNLHIGIQIVENVILFIPFGYWLRTLKVKENKIILGGIILSICIELSQFNFRLGLFEVDDILHNTIGAFFGTIIFDKLRFSEKKSLIGSGVVVVCSILFCFFMPKPETSVSEQSFYFGIEDIVSNVDNEIVLLGYCFAYDKPQEGYNLYLKSGNEILNLSSVIEQPSEDINYYFSYLKDYSNTAFTATVTINSETDYEIFVRWDSGDTMSTGIFLRGSELAYTSNPAPNFPGTLIASNPEYEFYVFQNDGELYWLCGEKFPFEEDGTTYIQYQLWTTQPHLLPEERLAQECFWDNLGFDFEKCEIDSIDGYRIAKKTIPTEYAVTAIVTGYHTDDKWVLKESFRPIVFDLFNYQRGLGGGEVK